MTRDYDLVMPSIIAVALAIGVRRLLSIENIYTVKLVGRGHFVPKALYANMFLVRHARDVMRKDITVLAADAHFDAFLRQHGEGNGLRYVMVTRGNHIAQVKACGAASRNPTATSVSAMSCRRILPPPASDIMFDVVQRITRRDAVMAIVISNGSRG